MEDTWKQVFLDSLRLKANVAHACRLAGISRSTAYNHRAKAEDDANDSFNEDWDLAIEDGLDQLEEDLIAVGRGEKKGQIGAFIYLLKARRYEKRNDQSAPNKLILQWGGDGS